MLQSDIPLTLFAPLRGRGQTMLGGLIGRRLDLYRRRQLLRQLASSLVFGRLLVDGTWRTGLGIVSGGDRSSPGGSTKGKNRFDIRHAEQGGSAAQEVGNRARAEACQSVFKLCQGRSSI